MSDGITSREVPEEFQIKAHSSIIECSKNIENLRAQNSCSKK